jgi:hypothetical protein
MERTIALALNKFPSVPLTLRETPTNDTARKEIRINLADLFHHYYHDSYGRSPPNPDPAQFEHLRFLVPEEGFRIQGDGIGISTAVRRNRSIELGQAFCRWFLHEHLNMTYFAHMKQALDGQLHPTYFAHHLERTQKGDTPDYFCARNANDVFLAEAKGGYEAAGFASKKFASWRSQFDRVVVKDGAGNPRRIKGFIVSTRFSTEESGPGVKSTLLAEDPETRGISALKRLLELDGFACETETALKGTVVPLLIEKNGKRVAVGLQSGLLDEDYNQHSLHPLNAGGAPRAIILNEYILRRNLPDEHQLIRDVF